jgi:hypothetical protein
MASSGGTWAASRATLANADAEVGADDRAEHGERRGGDGGLLVVRNGGHRGAGDRHDREHADHDDDQATGVGKQGANLPKNRNEAGGKTAILGARLNQLRWNGMSRDGMSFHVSRPPSGSAERLPGQVPAWCETGHRATAERRGEEG